MDTQKPNCQRQITVLKDGSGNVTFLLGVRLFAKLFSV